MALYHFSVKQVSRGKGQTVVNSAAYISGQKLYNDYYGQTHDYTKKSGVVFTEILTPEYVPEHLTDREMAEADTSGRSEEKREKQTKFPAFHAVQTEDIFEENGKGEQQPEQKSEKKTSLLRKLDEKKKECAERDAKQQVVKKKRNHEMSL